MTPVRVAVRGMESAELVVTLLALKPVPQPLSSREQQ